MKVFLPAEIGEKGMVQISLSQKLGREKLELGRGMGNPRSPLERKAKIRSSLFPKGGRGPTLTGTSYLAENYGHCVGWNTTRGSIFG